MEKVTQGINFELVNIEKAKKVGFAVVTVRFLSSMKEFIYVRRDVNNAVVIDGCEILHDDNFKLISIKRIYDTAGVKKTDTSNKKTKVSEKIKEEIIGQKIITPFVDGPVKHEKYDQIKMCLENNIPIYLAGPAGSGKNYTVEQIANELGWEFYFSNSVQQEYKLTGFIDAGGKFHETEFYKACTSENDCVFFLDEMDASIPEVLVLLNAAIANGYFEFPNGRVNFDKVHFVAAGNTVGSGADELYTGRMVLDQATLDRFAIIEFDYDRNIELSLTNGNLDLVNFIRELRTDAKSKGIRVTFSYRCMMMITKLEKAGMDLKVIFTIALIKGLDKDTVRTMKAYATNKYSDTLKEIQMAA